MHLYAIIKSGDNEYRVFPGQKVKVERLEAEPGETIEFGEVRKLVNGNQVAEGRPMVEGARVRAQVVKHGQDNGIIVFKMKRRRLYKHKSERQWQFTSLKINEIVFGDDVFDKRDTDPRKIKSAVAAAKASEAKEARTTRTPAPEHPPGARTPPSPKLPDDTVIPRQPTREPGAEVAAIPAQPPQLAHPTSQTRQSRPVERPVRKWFGAVALLVLLVLGVIFWNKAPSPQILAGPEPEVQPSMAALRLLPVRPADRPSNPAQPPD